MSKSYEIYKQSVEGITMNGEQMKDFNELPEKIRNAWKAIDDDKQKHCCYCDIIPCVFRRVADKSGKYACICINCYEQREKDFDKWFISSDKYKYN